MPYTFSRRADGQDIYAAHVNELQAAIESLSSDAAAYLDATETQALIDAAISGSGDLPASPGMGHDLASGPVAWRGAQVRDIRDWYYEDDTRTDREVFMAMAADIAAAGGGSVAVTAKPEGDGTWGWSVDTVTADEVDLPSNLYLFGAGEGGGQMRPTGGDHYDNVAFFRVYGPVHNGRIEGLTFKGDNGTDGAGFVYTLNWQSNMVWFLYDGDTGLGPWDWRVDRCTFRDLHGFSVHSPGGPETGTSMRRLAVTDSTFTYCGNGINLNCHHGQCRGNTILHSEGFENTGRNIVIADNLGIDMLHTCISIGGASQDDGPAVIVGNSFYGSTNEGISVGDGVRDAVIAGNVVVGVETTAFRQGTAFVGFAPYRLRVTGNVFRVVDAGGTAVVIGAEDVTFDHNDCGGGTQEALQIAAANGIYRGNTLDLGTSTPRAFQATAAAQNIFFSGDNVYTPFYFYDASAGAARFASGSAFRFTNAQTASAMWRGCTISVQGGAGVADTHARCTKDAADAYGWRDLLT